MEVTADTDLFTYAEAVAPWLAQDPVRHNVLLTLLESRRNGLARIEPGIVLLRVVDEGGSLVGVAVRTPPHALLVSAMPDRAVSALARYLVSRHPLVRRFNGPLLQVERLARQVAEHCGGHPQHLESHRMYQAEHIGLPFVVPGKAREATDADRDLLVAWADAFAHQALAQPAAVNPAPQIDSRLSRRGLLWVWEAGGEPVAMAALTPPSAGMVRVSLVYTPPRRRGNGYASALVAALSRRVLDSGNRPMLFTSLAHPTSNKIYQAIGYRPVGETAIWEVTGAAPATG